MSEEKLRKFYLTFGQSSPAKNGWITVLAENLTEAREKVFAEYGRQWSGLYEDCDWNPEYFPAGEIGLLR